MAGNLGQYLSIIEYQYYYAKTYASLGTIVWLLVWIYKQCAEEVNVQIAVYPIAGSIHPYDFTCTVPSL